MYIHNPPSDTVLRSSLQKILQKSFPEHHHLYLVNSVSDIELLDTTLKQLFTAKERVVVNTLSVAVALELRKRQIWLLERGINLISDYSNPTNVHQDKRVSFYSSEDCRPFISHVYKQISGSLSALIAKYQASITPIGSDILPDFPCKLDVDILICIPNKKDYISFCYELAQGDVFIVPPHIGEPHSFFYAELLGTPVDVHVCNSSLEENPMFRRTQQLQHDPKFREEYKRFKIENKGARASDYRKAKAAFRQKIGWISYPTRF